MSEDVAERVLAAKQQVENLKREVAEARSLKKKDYIGINKMGNGLRSLLHSNPFLSVRICS